MLQVILQGSPTAALKAVAECVSRLQDYPQLYIYSTDDVVIPYTSVEKVMRVGTALPCSPSLPACLCALSLRKLITISTIFYFGHMRSSYHALRSIEHVHTRLGNHRTFCAILPA